jgi:hypothetical protein
MGLYQNLLHPHIGKEMALVALTATLVYI